MLDGLLDAAIEANHPVSFDEGRFAIVTNVECGMRWTWTARKTNALVARTVKSCGPDAPMLALTRDNASHCAGMVARKPGSPRRSRKNPLKPLRGECRVNRCDRG